MNQNGTPQPFTIDRRPRIWVQWSGNDLDPVNAYDENLRKTPEDAAAWVLGRLVPLFDALAKVVPFGLAPLPLVLHSAVGKHEKDDRYSAALLGALNPTVLQLVLNVLRPLCRVRGCAIEPYVGWPYNPNNHASNRTNIKNGPAGPVDMMAAPSLRKWFDKHYRGVVQGRLWLDELAVAQLPAGRYADAIEREMWCTVGGEALPIVSIGDGAGPGGLRYTIDSTRIRVRPWLTVYSVMKTFDAYGDWTVNPATTEAHVIVRRSDAPTDEGLVELAKLLIARGFVVGFGWEVKPDVAARIVALQTPNGDGSTKNG